MDEYGCDYECRTVGEGITKYNIPDDWYTQFDVQDGVYPIISIQAGNIRKCSAMMELKLRIIENADDEYAGCMVLAENRAIIFKIDYMIDLVQAMETLLID